MRETTSLGMATWMLERLTPRSYSQAVCGDLLEEFYAGRTTWWYWRQVACAIGMSAWGRARRYAVPLLFSGMWSALYPVWGQAAARDAFLQGELGRWSVLDWPYSAIAAVGGAFLPAASFVWLGFFVYLWLPAGRTMRPSGMRVVGSLSVSLNVLLVVALATHGVVELAWSGPIAHATPWMPVLRLPLVLALFAALLSALPAVHGGRGERHFRV